MKDQLKERVKVKSKRLKMKYLKNNQWVVGLGLIVVLIALFLVFDCKNTSQNKPSLSQDDIRNLQWLNKVNPLDYSTYNIYAVNGKAKFMNGQYKFDDGYAYIENGATGELDNDGIDEAATMLFVNNGGTGKYPELVVLKKDGESYTEVSSIGDPIDFFYDRIYVQSIQIEDKLIDIKILGHGPTDGLCCPSVPMEKKFRIVDNKLEEEK